MKKAIILLVVLALGTAVLAAAAKKPAAKIVNENYFIKENVVVQAKPAPQANSNLAIILTDIGCPLVSLPMAGYRLDLGGNINSPAAGRTDYTLIIRGEIPWNTYDRVQTYWAPEGIIQSIANASVLTARFKVGGEFLFTSNLSLYGEITLISLTSTAGVTTWTVGNNNAQGYAGLKLYI